MVKTQILKALMSIFEINMENASKMSTNMNMFGPVVVEIACGILIKEGDFLWKFRHRLKTIADHIGSVWN